MKQRHDLISARETKMEDGTQQCRPPQDKNVIFNIGKLDKILALHKP
jgi:hypothetical protein